METSSKHRRDIDQEHVHFSLLNQQQQQQSEKWKLMKIPPFFLHEWIQPLFLPYDEMQTHLLTCLLKVIQLPFALLSPFKFGWHHTMLAELLLISSTRTILHIFLQMQTFLLISTKNVRFIISIIFIVSTLIFRYSLSHSSCLDINCQEPWSFQDFKYISLSRSTSRHTLEKVQKIRWNFSCYFFVVVGFLVIRVLCDARFLREEV